MRRPSYLLLTNCHPLYQPPLLHFYNLHWNCQFLRQWVIFFPQKVIGTSRLLESHNFHTEFLHHLTSFWAQNGEKRAFLLLTNVVRAFDPCVAWKHKNVAKILLEISIWHCLPYCNFLKHTYSIIRLMYYIPMHTEHFISERWK